MHTSRFYLFIEIAIIVLLGYLSYQIFSPFFTAIAWAIVFGVVFYPVYAFLLRYIRLKAVASLITLFLMLTVIIGPFSYVSFTLVSEVSDIIGKTGTEKIEAVKSIMADRRVTEIIEKLQPYVGLDGISAENIIMENTKKFGAVVLDKLSTGFTNIAGVAVNFFIMLFTVFFFLKDAPDLLRKLKDYLPFSEHHKNRLTIQIKDMIVSTIYGGVIVAITQGILGGLAFALLGIGSPVLWGSIMALMSFVPVAGTAIIWVPASIVLVLQGAYIKGAALIFIGIFVISMVDNILKPLIIGGRTRMPAIVIFFTVLGGIKFFGLLGLVMGPLVFALFLSIFEIFRTAETEGAGN